MDEIGLVVLTDTLLDYALAAAARRKLVNHLSSSGCYPLFAPNGLAPEQASFMLRHNFSAKRLTDLVGGADPAARSRELARCLPWTGGTHIGLPAEASAAQVLGSLLASFAEDRPLIVDAEPSHEQLPLRLQSGDEKRLVIARVGSVSALPAAVYAEMTGKNFTGLTDLDDVEDQLTKLNPLSIILADDLDRITKSFLSGMLKWSHKAGNDPVLLGIMTGQSFAQLSGIVCRLLVHRDFRSQGGHLFEPPSPESVPVQHMEPMEFCIITAHGNEMHLRHSADEVLCGAVGIAPNGGDKFDCERQCPHRKRVRSSAVPAHAICALSCDAFTLGDGLVPPEFNILLNFLNGWASTVLAPFKHVQGNMGLSVLANALIHSGYSIGEVAQRLNAVCRLDDVPDYSYLVLGDPDVVPKSGATRSDTLVATARSHDGLDVACEAGQASALEIVIPFQEVLEVFGSSARRLAVEPLSESLQSPDIYFSLRHTPDAAALSICVFGKNALPVDTLVFRLIVAEGFSDHDRKMAFDHLKHLNALANIEFLIPTVRSTEAQILSTMRTAIAYPRAIELLQGHAIVRGIASILTNEFRSARQDILHAILDEMACKRIWISQIYAPAYPIVRQLDTRNGICDFCGNALTAWSYQDGFTDLFDRTVVICDRCGISEDRPAAAELEIKLATCQSLTSVTHRQAFSVRNRSTRTIELSLLHQFNEWQQLGIEVDPGIEEFTLAAGEQVDKSAVFRFPPDLPDGLLQMQFFALTDRFCLQFVGQKVKSVVRAKGMETTRRRSSINAP